MQDTMRISPNFDAPHITSRDNADEHIDVYADRLAGWLFGPAEALVALGDDGWMPALALLIGYFEGHAVYRDGMSTDKRGKAAFKSTLEEVCPILVPAPGHEHVSTDDTTNSQIGDILYEDGRCGLYHDGFLRRRVLVGVVAVDSTFAASTDGSTGRVDAVVVNVAKLLEGQRGHAAGYVARLRDPKNTELRSKFLAGWYLRNPDEPLHFPDRPPGGADGAGADGAGAGERGT